MIKKIDHNGQTYKLGLYDTAGQERFRSLTSVWYRGAKGCIFVYSIDSRESFESVNSWIEECRIHCKGDFVGMILANKLDLEDRRQVSYDEGMDLAERNNMMFIEASAKTAAGIEEAFQDVFQQIIFKEEDQRAVAQDQLYQLNNNMNGTNVSSQGVVDIDTEQAANLDSQQQGGCC